MSRRRKKTGTTGGTTLDSRPTNITQILHPDYRGLITDWYKWRLTYIGGQQFINTYLKRFSKRETELEFKERKHMAYCPAFAKSALNEIKGAITQRLCDIRRVGGDSSYNEAMDGKEGGVDLHGASMDCFLTQQVIPELMSMGKVGIYVDMPELSGETIAENFGKRPYLYTYVVEDIRSWSYGYANNQYQYTNVLLRDHIETVDAETDLVNNTVIRYRKVWLDTDGVHIQYFDNSGQDQGEEIVLENMKRIPFITLELSQSLLQDVANYQVALLNMENSDLNYILRSNFPLYTEQYEPRAESTFNRRRAIPSQAQPGFPSNVPILGVGVQIAPVNPEFPVGSCPPINPGQQGGTQPNPFHYFDDDNSGGDPDEIDVGAAAGRRYPKGSERPGFIHPSSEPVTASMQKQYQLKNDIRHLLNLALSNLEPKFASAESKGMDSRSMESGLTVISQTLQYAENELAKVWLAYMGIGGEIKVRYPRKFSLLSEDDKRKNAEELKDLMPIVPSLSYKKAVAVKIANALLSDDLTEEDMDEIKQEIADAPYLYSTALDVQQDVEVGLCTEETASTARGYDGNVEVPKARAQRLERLAAITKAQTPPDVQGVKDTQTDPNKPLNPGAGRPPVSKE